MLKLRGRILAEATNSNQAMLTLTSVWATRRANSSAPPAVDRRALIEQAGGNLSCLRDLIRVYRAESDEAMRVLREAITASDNQLLYAEAAGLGGALGCLHATQAQSAAMSLQLIAQEEKWPEVEGAVQSLIAEMQRVETALDEWAPPPAGEQVPAQRFTYATGP